MPDEIYRKSDIKKLRKVRELTPESFKAYTEFDKQVMADGALPKKAGATEQEIIESAWVAAALRAGGAFTHSVLALNSYEE